MTLKTILRTAEKFAVDNTPGILTALGVAGTITTAILAGKAVAKSVRIIDERARLPRSAENWEQPDDFHQLENKLVLQLVWKEFLPTAVMGVVTITSIIAANRVGARRAAAIAAAFKISEELSEQYKQKVTEALGKQKEEKVRSELAAERMDRIGGGGMIVVAGSESVFFDALSGRFFKAEMEAVRKAVNDVNYQVNNNFYASLTDFYNLLGLEPTQFSDEVGWNTDGLLDVSYTATLIENGSKPAIQIEYNHTPIRGYDRCQ